MADYRTLLQAAAIVVAGLSLVACDSIRDAAGITKQPPDEFAVVTKAPLIIPPDFNLHPPKPGAAPLNQTSPTQAAEAALYGDDPNTIAASITGNYSPAEKLLLANSGAAVADDSIRRTIAADNRNAEDTDQSLTDALLFGSPPDTSGNVPVNADAERSRMDAQNAGGNPAPKDTATIDKPDDSGDKDSGSWWWPF